MAAEPSNPPACALHLPAELHYECIRCGRSCGEFWEIPVDSREAERIRSLAPDSLGPAGAADPRDALVENPWSPGTLMMRQAGGRCGLQRADGLCALHAAHGLAAKPNICQSFPYKFIETPGGVFVGLSFACTAVLGDLGPAVSEQSAEIEALYPFTHSRRRVTEPLTLTEDLPLSWSQYAQVEDDLAAILDPAHGPIGQRLIMQSIYLRLLIQFLRESRKQGGTMLAGPEANDAVLAVFRRRLRGPAEDPWPLPRRLAQRRGPSPLLRRMFLGVAHALRNTYGERRGRLGSYRSIFGAYFLWAVGRGALDLPALGRPIAYARLRRIGLDAAQPEFDRLLTRYFRHRLFRKELLLGDSIQMTHHLQLLHWGLIAWYGTALAADAGADEVGLEHLREAVRNVEKYYVFHSTFDRLFGRHPILRAFLERIFEHPLYAYSMGHDERVKGEK